MTSGSDRDLVHRAASALADGPVHTLELGHAVLGLSGNPRVAAAAVFTLLAADQRFSVDGEGNWTLQGSPPGCPLRDLAYAVVDVETTGGPYGRGHRVTEIAVYHVDAGVITDDFQTLVNPGRSIPPRIEVMTGITNEMVKGAPYFDQIASDLYAQLEHRVFVAHNVAFDWGFVSNELADAIGQVPSVARLCTVQMSRKLLPRLRRRNLDSVTRHFDIPVEARHRAWGDALATARVLLRLVDLAEQEGLADLEALNAFLGRSPQRTRPRQGQQLSFLAEEESCK